MSISQLLKNRAEKSGNFTGQLNGLIRTQVERFKDEIKQELQSLLQESIGEEGALALKGERGFTPQRGIDYLKPEEIETIKKEITPIKGQHYFDGLPGKNGTNVSLKDLQYFIGKELKKIPKDMSLEKAHKEIVKILEELRKEIELLKNRPQTPVYGKRGGGGMSDPRHESFTGDGSTTSFTLARSVAASGTAIIVRYNGQVQDLTTHYTVAGAVVSMTFTPADGTTISITYWPG